MLKKFWNNVGKKVWLSDYKESLIPTTTFRSPAPASQPEYKKPVVPASAISNNYYYKRDVRRNYPQTEVYTQSDIGRLLLGPSVAEKIAAPAATATAEGGAERQAATVPAVEVKDVVEALQKVKGPIYSAANMPPVPGTAYTYKLSPEQYTEGPGEYYPSYRVY
ncbi:hypothetical protein BX661DRAFT_178485 [Kickxella alabastrina]|uniref:uncharacterized protein n=1 Tax=Kickxella alabastrina TaxID=61397 RepID=UPI00221F0379|nr:uncharacterized protein BX661DRAFT_178485 [Kickxella alabastrina]KAI7833491.1 hypothetical protein BX661DRAFT_178485 [Kickxella alabastrina]KAJ1936878.1 hypothetical protein GGF37_005432 [Kickxella alabastrina]